MKPQLHHEGVLYTDTSSVANLPYLVFASTPWLPLSFEDLEILQLGTL